MDITNRKPLRTTDKSDERSLQASKWLQIQVLLDVHEMELLFAALGEFYIYRVGAITKIGEELISCDQFLSEYREYIDALKQGEMPDVDKFRRAFANVLTVSSEALFSYKLSPDEHIVRVSRPIIQMQSHAMHYSKDDQKFRPLVFGYDSILWGVQFSYPQIYQDIETMQIKKVDQSDSCMNSSLFSNLQHWLRQHTRPTPMVVEDKMIKIPIKIGHDCLAWINCHPQLKQKGMHVGNQ